MADSFALYSPHPSNQNQTKPTNGPTARGTQQEETEYRVCDATGEDFTCSNSYLFQFDLNDHREYLGVPF